jgi:hypothetical protein
MPPSARQADAAGIEAERGADATAISGDGPVGDLEQVAETGQTAEPDDEPQHRQRRENLHHAARAAMDRAGGLHVDDDLHRAPRLEGLAVEAGGQGDVVAIPEERQASPAVERPRSARTVA